MYRIVLHSQDAALTERACVVRPQHGLVARCAAGCGTVLDVDALHVHLLYGKHYEGYCSEGCAIKGIKYLTRIGRLDG